MDSSKLPEITVVIPAFNEAEALPILLTKLQNVLRGLSFGLDRCEIIIVNDGSTDCTKKNIIEWCSENFINIKLINFRKNKGKSAALSAAFFVAAGKVVITMDADLQDEPEEIPNLLESLENGNDLVSGWKKIRHDSLEKRMPSRLFNKVVSKLSGQKLNDFNCGLKAYKKEVIKDLNLYGELHRFIPVLAAAKGWKVSEIPVQHHSRAFGVSKYGIERYLRGFLDLATVLFLNRYRARPLHFFGGVGLTFLFIGFLISLYLSILWFMGFGIGGRPLFFLGMLMIISGFQLFSLGLVGEILTNRYESVPDYELRELTGKNE